MKKLRHCEEENKEGEDRLSDLSDCLLLRILSFLNAKHVVQTCILSKRYEHLWKHIPTLILQASTFATLKQFSKFVSKILTLRDTSTALLALDLHRPGISVCADSALIFPHVSSCQFLTSLKLLVYHRGLYYNNQKTVFPKALNLPVLTNLDLTSFAFSSDGNDYAEPFSAFGRLNSLAVRDCTVKDARILNISSETLVNLDTHSKSSDFAKIELSTPESLYPYFHW
ncbi:putative F-box domain, leucine-rich repeat domain, L domain-containing protein [Medicago truncatula]|uniref:Putative F-box domain, leucine-rich repeat domain, L domain-containing protein n=1 Tax=Medicago truncatula TaxID=3880 RepID=A0A396IAC0_MEDTR|nr:putative F-box domain, leucine-rich repeat domain, L domain-containing protein [Medicago truncatula]